MDMLRGTCTSLYSTLSDEHVGFLERAVHYTITGQYADSRSIFEGSLSGVRDIPVVAIERSELALRQGRYKEIWETLETAIAALPSENPKTDSEDASHRLMKLLHAFATIHYKGIQGPARHEIRRVREWLADTPIAKYTDVQVSIVRIYTIASQNISINEKNDELETSLVPISEGRNSPWKGLTDLRISLLRRDMVFEALALFKAERSRIPYNERIEAHSSFASDLRSCCKLSGSQMLWIKLELSYLLAMIYQELEEFSKASEELAVMERLIDDWCEMTLLPSSQKERLSHHINLRYVKIGLLDDADHRGRYEQSLELLKDAEASGHHRTTSCLYLAGNAAKEIAYIEGKPEMHQEFLDLHRKEAAYEEFITGDLSELVLGQNCVLLDAGRNYVDQRKALEWMDGFLERYPSFSLPSILQPLHALRRLYADSLGEVDKSAESGRVFENLAQFIPLRRGPLVGIRPTVPQSKPDKADQAWDAGSWGQLEIGSLEEQNFYIDWETTVTDRVRQALMAMSLLLKWGLEDLQNGILSLGHAMDIFVVPEQERSATINESTAAVIQGLSLKTGNELFESLYYLELPSSQQKPAQDSLPSESGTQNASRELHPVSVEAWENRLAAIIRWLRTSSQSTVSSRQSLLLNLQDIRVWSLKKTGLRFLDGVVMECERALDIFERLHTPVKRYFASNRIIYQSDIGDACLNMLYNSTQQQIMEESEKYFEMAERYYTESIGGYLREGSLGLAAFGQRSMATVYVMRVIRAALKQEDPHVITKLRDAGLDFLNEADMRFSQAEVEATWSGGLDGFRNRQHVANSHHPSLNPRIAVSLLMEGNPDPDEHVRTLMWEWVQRAKAQSLASTTGLNRTDPPSIVNSLVQSKPLSELYLHLLELRSKISATSPSERFYLRLELDQHIEEMRKHELLKKLLDGREGKHLSADDLREMSRQTGGNVVFVDWFFLPGFYRGVTSRLLLFTRREGSAPTLDVLATKVEDVFGWISKYLDKREPLDQKGLPALQDEGAAEGCVMKISSLVEPLEKRSNPGDLLVLCPTDVLHRIPLHALRVKQAKGKPKGLIHRNPVVYIHSHSLLRPCYWASNAAMVESGTSINPFFMNAASYSEGEFQPNYAAGHETTIALSKRYGRMPALHSTQATKANLLDALGKTRMLYVHSHCRWDSANPLEHCIEFPRPAKKTLSTEFSKEKAGLVDSDDDDYILPAREIFSLQGKLQMGSHLNLLVCSGALTRLNRGDEPFGLVPALLYSGAASTVSTLWDMRDTYAAAFGREFYAAYAKECQASVVDSTSMAAAQGNGSGKWINVAKVMQRAVKKLDRYESKPLEMWSGFVMHGFWMMWVGNEDMERFL